MKIVNIVPGFGGTFYCGNCLRDSGFVHTLKELGHEAHTLPIYLPLFASEDQNEMDSPVFYGAVNIYLKQNYKMFRKMPKWLYRFFDSPAILRFAARKAGSTRASGLEEMTLSMLQGHEGYQKEELDMLVNYLKHHEKPDIVHLSNALLLGLAPKIREETGARVVCSLQDEDVWIDPMEEEWQKKIWKKMSDMGEAVSAFISVSDFFANLMFARMHIPSEKMHVVHIGVDPDHYSVKIPASDPPVIGYISRTNEENGFALLVDAFIHLKENSQFKNAKLKVTGGKTSDDNRFLKKQMNKLRNKGFLEDVEMLDEFKSVVSVDFFEGLTLLSVPVLKGEAFGLYQLEALASGIPIVQPALAAFPEIAETSGGGVVYHPNTPEALSEKWAEVLSNPDKIKKMGAAGRKSVEKVFNIHRLTNEIVEVYRSILPRQGNQRTGI